MSASRACVAMLLLWVCVAAGCVEPGTTVIGREEGSKTYLNLSLPGYSRFAPLVVRASLDESIVARVTDVGGNRDIQVLRVRQDGWSYLGENGNAVTGTDGTFLEDAVTGPDGRIWVLAAYSRVSNAERGDREYLYVLEENKWRLAGPKEGCELGSSAGRLYFLGGNEPVHLSRLYAGKNRRDLIRLLQLQNDAWIEHPAQATLRKSDGALLFRQQDALWIRGTPLNGTLSLQVWVLGGPGQSDVRGPYPLLSVPVGFALIDFAAARDGRIAVLMRGPTGILSSGPWLLSVAGDYETGGPRVFAPPPPPVETVDRFAFSPTGELVLTTMQGARSLFVYTLRDGKWAKVAAVRQLDDVGVLFDHRLFFRVDGTPLVTWEDFWPR